ncbi:MAG TPA: tryptophan synthase subunit alpha, partial [Fimbriimonadales bacterium]|nr:tryptophan synthase subunit alpha [Fimbriimonadales bacterium]
AVSKARVAVPLIYMGYTNMAMRRGFGRFARDAQASGASGVILSDMTPDEATEWRSAARSAELDTIFLVAPTSTDERIRLAAEASTGFIYCVSRTGVTGAGTVVPPEVVATVGRIRSLTDLPVCVGFGISTKEHVEMVCKVADGAVVGSYLVDMLHRVWGFPKGRDEIVNAIRALKEGTLQSQ